MALTNRIYFVKANVTPAPQLGKPVALVIDGPYATPQEANAAIARYTAQGMESSLVIVAGAIL